MPRPVASLEEVEENIRIYSASVQLREKLAARIRQHPAWYATRDQAGNWLFGPSKFIGYRDADAGSYLAGYSRKDGRETEPTLARWFAPVNPGSALGRELRAAFERFAARHGKTPNARWRVSVPVGMLEAISTGPSPRGISDRIAFDPAICGGRPHIRGTRVRVSDIVAALSEGETAGEILGEYPYLSQDDIRAALQYAARAVDHRVLVAA